MTTGRIPMFQETHDKLEEQLHALKTVDRPNIIKEIAEARSNGDLSENAEYHAAREKQGEIENNIRILEDKLARAEVIKVSAENSDHVIFGATVKVKDLKANKEISYTLVSPDGVNLLEGKISAQSPIGKGLMGKKVGETTKVKTPKGELELEILEFH